MKLFVATALFLALVAFAHSYPGVPRDEAKSDEDSGENEKVELVLPEGFSEESPLFGFFNPFQHNVYSNFFDRINTALKTMRESIHNSSESGLPWGFGKIPDGANTTSETKVINGHRVVVNETTYTKDGENGGTFFRVRIVDVKPEQNPDAEPVATPGSNVSEEAMPESAETDKNNESSNANEISDLNA